VDVILWASWYAVTQQMNTVFPLYAKMGVKGFKIDFVDRDDQKAVASLYEIAGKAAENHLLVDYHGVFKPTGLQRTYPNVVGYEGVKGLENIQVGRGRSAALRREHSLHTYDGRSDGLYPRRHEKCRQGEFQADKRESDESGYPLPATGNVCCF
jgi:hypothetical protein